MYRSVISLIVTTQLLSGCYMLGAPMSLSDIEKRDDQDTYICGQIGGPPPGGKVGIVSVPKGKPIPSDWRLPQCCQGVVSEMSYHSRMWRHLGVCFRNGQHKFVYAHARRVYCWECFHRFWDSEVHWQTRLRHYLGYLVPLVPWRRKLN